MIKLENYPEVAKAYKNYRKLIKKGYHYEIKGHEIGVYEKKGTLQDIAEWDKKSRDVRNEAGKYEDEILLPIVLKTFHEANVLLFEKRQKNELGFNPFLQVISTNSIFGIKEIWYVSSMVTAVNTNSPRILTMGSVLFTRMNKLRGVTGSIA
jgi:hypothetical protein